MENNNSFQNVQQFLEALKVKLAVSDSYSIPDPKDSIMSFENICDCDSGFLCEHRRDWLFGAITGFANNLTENK
jgi:hypothetical protein